MDSLETFTLLIVCFKCLTINAQEVRLKTGQKYQVVGTSNLKQLNIGAGIDMQIGNKTEIVANYEVVNVWPVSADLRMTLVKAKVSVEPDLFGDYDSERASNPGVFAQTIAPIINKPVMIVVDSRGNVIERAGVAVTVATGEEDKLPGTDKFPLINPAFHDRVLAAGTSFSDSVKITLESYTSEEIGTYTVTAVKNGLAEITYNGIKSLTTKKRQLITVVEEITTITTENIKSTMTVDVMSKLVMSNTTVAESKGSWGTGNGTMQTTTANRVDSWTASLVE